MLYKRLVTDRERAVELRLDETAAAIIPAGKRRGGEGLFDTEFLDYILAVKCVEDVKEAVAHIAAHSTGHSEAIVTREPGGRAVFYRQCGQRGGVCQRVHPVHRRRRIRLRV